MGCALAVRITSKDVCSNAKVELLDAKLSVQYVEEVWIQTITSSQQADVGKLSGIPVSVSLIEQD
jgi:hypothetical protein